MSTREDNLIDRFKVKHESKWKSEDEIELETLQKSRLRISRIVFDEPDKPVKRCIAFSKNRKSIAFDIEMVPVNLVSIIKLTPATFIPDDLKEDYERIRDMILNPDDYEKKK